MALSRVARAFNKNPTVENFRKLAHERPAEAATWVRDFGDSAGLPRKLLDGLDSTRWDSNLSDAEKTKKLEKLLVTHGKSVEKAIAKATKADEVSPLNLGWSTAESEAQVTQGRLSKGANGNVSLKTSKGTFAIAQAGDSQLATRDISTFAGSTVSIRGYLEKASTGRGRALVALEWTPGQHKDFVSGRVAKDGEKIGIRVSTDKFVEITNPEFKALLQSWEKVGLSFAGDVKKAGKGWVFDGPQPDEVHMLTSLGDPPAGAKGQYSGAITPSPMTSSTPTVIIGPKVDTTGYVRRFVAGRIVAPDPAATAALPPNPYGTMYPSRTFEMAKAWKGIDGNVGYSNDSGLQFSPVYDGAGNL